jgi:hypothetical protein
MPFDPSTATPFDPSSAQPVDSGFDPSSAQPVTVAHGFDAIPKDPRLAGMPAAAPVAPTPQPTITQKVVGGIEAGLNILSGITNYGIGLGSGVVRAGIVGAAEEAAAFATKADQASRGVSAPLPEFTPGEQSIQQEIQNVTAQPQTPVGKQYTETAQDTLAPVMGSLPGLLGHAPEMAALHAGAAPVVQAATDATKSAASTAGRAVAKGAAKVISVDPELAKVAQIAGDLKYPIDIAPDQVVGNAKFTKLAGQASRDVPLSGSKTEPNQVAFTRNVINELNPDETADRLTPPVFADAMDRSGQGIGDITAKTPVPLDDINKPLEDLRAQVDAKAYPDDAKIIGAYIDEIQAKADEGGVIDGETLKNLNSEIGRAARSNAGNPLGERLNDLQGIIQDGVEQNVADPADVQALRDYRREYAYGKILEPAVAKTIDGKMSPAALMNQVTSTKLGKHLMATARGGPLGDLAKVGQLIKEPGSSLTAERSLVYAGLGGAGYVEPHTAAAIYAGANAYNRLGPGLTRALISKGEERAALPELPPAEPTTSPGAGGGGDGGPAPAGPGPLGDLTPDWSTTPGAGGGPPRGGNEPGLVPSIDDTPPTTGNRKAPLQVPAVPGRPDLPDTLVSGGPSETAATDASNAAMNEPGAIEARRQQTGAAARETPAQGPSIAEAQRLLGENPSPEVRKVLEAHVETAKQAQRDRAAQEEQDAKASQLERTARTTTDPVIQKALLAEADKLRGTKPIPAGEIIEGQPEIKAGVPTKPLPVGKVIEGEPAPEKVPAGKATEKTLTEDEWKKQFGLGDEDAQRAKDVAVALQHDAPAVEAAAVQFEKSPRAFDRAVAEITEKGEARANEAQPAAEGSEGVPGAGAAQAADTAGASVPAGKGSAPVHPIAEDHGPVSAASADAGGVAQSESAAAVPGADQHAGANSVPAAGRGGVPATGARRQGADQSESAGSAGVAGAANGTDTTAKQSGAAGDLRGQGQAPDEGPEEVFHTTGKETPVTFPNPEALEAHLRTELGNKLIDGLQEQGLLRFANSVEENKKGAGGVMRQPNFPDLENMDDTHATLFYNEIGPHNATGVLMHELGEHFGMIRLLGKQRYGLLLNEVKKFEHDPATRMAWEDVKRRYVGPDTLTKYESTDDPNFLREVAAHLVETKPDLPFVRRLVNDIRVFFYTHFGSTLGTSVDANLIRGMAASALRKAAAGELPGQKAVATAKTKFTPLVATPRADGFPPLYQ